MYISSIPVKPTWGTHIWCILIEKRGAVKILNCENVMMSPHPSIWGHVLPKEKLYKEIVLMKVQEKDDGIKIEVNNTVHPCSTYEFHFLKAVHCANY